MRLLRIIPIGLAILALVGVAGCGGDDGDTGGGAPDQQQPTTGNGAADGGAGPDGEQLFASACGSCHTLSAAGTTGTVGPNLDDLQPDKQRVLNAIETGPKAMPEGLYSGAEAEAVAEFVSQNAGQ